MERISQYLENQQFIDWVFSPTEKLDDYWQKNQIKNPDEKQNILLARKVLQKFRTVDKLLTEQEKILLFSKILSDIEEQHISYSGRRLFFAFVRYAAVAVLFFSIGSLLFFQRNYVDTNVFMFGIGENSIPSQTTLTRPNGETIGITGNKSEVAYKSGGNLEINEDTIKLNRSSSKDETNYSQLVVPYGKTSRVLLADGTTVFLNAGSKLVYPEEFTSEKREVYLSGEAFFEVHKDLEHPFIVATSEINVEVKGTKFNVSAYPSDLNIETVLTEGKVRIRQNRSGLFNQSLDLEASQMAIYNRLSDETTISPVDVRNYVLWKDGIFRFESSELSWVIKKLERYYNISLCITDQKLKSLRISGKLELNEERESVLDILVRTASVKMVKKGDNSYEITN